MRLAIWCAGELITHFEFNPLRHLRQAEPTSDGLMVADWGSCHIRTIRPHTKYISGSHGNLDEVPRRKGGANQISGAYSSPGASCCITRRYPCLASVCNASSTQKTIVIVAAESSLNAAMRTRAARPGCAAVVTMDKAPGARSAA